MKPLKPSHREKKRYLLIIGNDANEEKIEEIILEFIGVLGYSQVCPKIIKKDKNKLILAINHKALDKVKAAFLISGKNLEITRVSGTLEGLK
jgi:RNase P/RNase MRP subunit POP5